ncbi:ATP-binding protein [Vibrio lentus]|nr:RloA protein [Vibrio lentus]PMJ06165.1 RloA protein [Vibrio lentus]TKG21044.1 ATP-binding protein [Vibrio lentus]
MLIQFSAKNFKSIKDEITFQMTKGSGNEISRNVFVPEATGTTNMSLLKSAAIYGPNASGKSTIVEALNAMKSAVLSSGSDEDVEYNPFLYSSTTRQAPTEFSIDFICNSVRYQYGFAFNSKVITEEWLFAYPKSRAQTWFYREYDEDTNSSKFTKDGFLTGKKSTWKDATRNDALFLSTAVQLNSKQLKPIYDWFKNTLRSVGFNGVDPYYTATQVLEKDYKLDVLDFLRGADLDIDDLNIETEDFDESTLPEDMPLSLRKLVIENLKGRKHVNAQTGRKDDEGNIQYLNIDDESDGTKRMFSFAAPIIDCLKHGYVIVVDELHNSLHPAMVQYLVSLFNCTRSNPSNAQLVFTTHETSILSQDIFRRDQIWFCEKGQDKSTSLYSLHDFRVRKGVENIERNYLSGKYGAMPFIESFCGEE